MRTTILLFVILAVLGTGFVARAEVATEEDQENWVLSLVQELRLAGQLDRAREAAENGLRAKNISREDAIALRFELAKIYDRQGLHLNTRPVEAALREIQLADAMSVNLGPAEHGAVDLAKANYYYRAEMAEREFAKATVYVNRAIASLQEGGDVRAQSDAVHQLGLIHMQKRELERARELFDESLALDREAGERSWMRGEYHRHVGFIDAMNGDWEAALSHFEASLAFRKEAGAIDASLFAAISLASALIETGDVAAAEPYLVYALQIARGIRSPVGTARASIVLGRMYEQLGRQAEARAAYEATLAAARSVGYETLVTRAEDAVRRLDAEASEANKTSG